MKKLLLATVAVFTAATINAASFGAVRVNELENATPVKMENVKKAPAALQQKMVEKAASRLKAKAPNFPISSDADLTGAYDWYFRQYTGGLTNQPDTLAAANRDQEDNVSVIALNVISDTQVRLTDLFMFPVTATLGTSGNYKTFVIDDDQTVYYHSSYGACNLTSLWYYEGDATYEAGWYISDLTGFIVDLGIIFDQDIHFYYEIASGTYAGYRLGWIYEPGSVLIPNEKYNGLMTNTFTNSNSKITATYDYPVIVSEDTETYEVSVANFADYGDEAVVKFNLAEDKSFTAPAGQVFATVTSGSTTINYTLVGLNEAASSIYPNVTGTGDETALTFGSNWTGYDATTGYWIFNRSATTITLIDGSEYEYPKPAPTSITLNKTDEDEVALIAGETVQLSVVSVEPEGASTEVTWESSDPSIATVDENGLVTGQEFDGNEINKRNGAAAPYDKHFAYYPVTITATAVGTSNTPATASVTIYVQSSVKTAVENINAAGNVQSVKYVNAQGMVSATPFDGMNIQVTKLSDGTTKTVKVIK